MNAEPPVYVYDANTAVVAEAVGGGRGQPPVLKFLEESPSGADMQARVLWVLNAYSVLLGDIVREVPEALPVIRDFALRTAACDIEMGRS